MGFLDRLLGREEREPGQTYSPPPVPRREAAPQRTDDEIAVERYQYLLRTAPPETIEQVHTEAFAKLTPEQRDLLFRQLSENASPSERPANAEPATLAKAATRAELQQPGTLARSFGNQGGNQGQGGMSFGGMIGSSMLGTIAGYVIGSALVSSFMPMDGGADAGGDSGGDGGGDSGGGSDAGSTEASGADASGADSGGDFGGGGFGDFGGGGGDFGGDFGF